MTEVQTTPRVAVSRHGDEGPLTLLLHGQGAAGLVWDGVIRESALGRGPCRFVVPDLPGHGDSGRLHRYTAGAYAAAIADLLPVDEPVVAVGHSLGGLVALTLATGQFGVEVAQVICLAVKVRWTPEEAAGRARRAHRPRRRHPDADAARASFARAAGLAARTREDLDVGIAVAGDEFVLVHDPATAALPPAPAEQIARIASAVPCPIRLVCGDADPMVTPADMATMGPTVEVVAGAGHNLHIDDPGLVADLIHQTGGDR